jgi:hypothetical protein
LTYTVGRIDDEFNFCVGFEGEEVDSAGVRVVGEVVRILGVDGDGAFEVWDCGATVGGAEKVFWSKGGGYEGDDGEVEDHEGGLGR